MWQTIIGLIGISQELLIRLIFFNVAVDWFRLSNWLYI